MFRVNVRQLAIEKDWNISDLWRATGAEKSDRVDYNTLILYWHGYIKRMNIKDLVKICDALECDLCDLIGYTHNKKP